MGGIDLSRIAIIIVPVLLAITLHEASHALAAHRLGDDTAAKLGRVTLNPLRHIDPIGTIVLPIVLALTAGFIFGWAKPVPVRFDKLRQPRRDMMLVALAGPAANVVLAVIFAVALVIVGSFGPAAPQWLISMCWLSVFFNLLLALFNLLPIPPLDGGRVVIGLLPYDYARRFARLERYGLLIVVGLAIVLPLVSSRAFGMDIDLLRLLVIEPARYLSETIVRFIAAGLPL